MEAHTRPFKNASAADIKELLSLVELASIEAINNRSDDEELTRHMEFCLRFEQELRKAIL